MPLMSRAVPHARASTRGEVEPGPQCLVRLRLRDRCAGLLFSTLAVLAGSLLSPLAHAAVEDDWQGVARIVAVGDLHGDYENYLAVLTDAGLINRRGRWTGGATHLVQLGDVPDRGPDTHKIIAHLRGLESQALKDGGRVHALIGNHEAMNMDGDLRYVDPGEYAALVGRQSRRLRENYFAQVLAFYEAQPEPPVLDAAFREEWFESHPLGFVEHRQRWHPEGEFGAWVSEHNAMVRINRMLFVHGGISPAYLDRSITSINEQLRKELKDPSIKIDRISEAEDGPLWYRGLSQGDETPEEAAHLKALLAHFDVDHIVLGHTPGFATVVPRYDARVLVVDSGIGAYYGGYRASLLVKDNELFTVQRGEPVKIPDTSDGLLDYYKKISAIEPGVNNLQVMIQRLSASTN